MIKNTNKTIIINIYFFYIFPILKAPTVKNNKEQMGYERIYFYCIFIQVQNYSFLGT